MIEIGKQILDDGTLGKAIRMDVRQLLTTKLLITANSGGGKSWALRKLFESIGVTTQLIVLDVEGEFITLREKLDMVLVGPQGEIPTDVRSAGLLVRRLMEKELSAVIDMSELSPGSRRHYVRGFCESMLALPKELWKPCFIGIDEAQMFCPEKGHGESESTESLIDLCSRSRKRAYCPILATQRISKLHKDAAAECNNKLIGRATLDLDRNRAADELGMSRKDALSLRELHSGQFHCFGPAFKHDGVALVKVGDVETTHPKPGHGKSLKPPKPSTAITAVVAELADLPREAEQEIKDLATAKSKIAELQREMKKIPAPQVVQDKNAPKVSDLRKQMNTQAAQIKILKAGLEQAMKVMAKIDSQSFEAAGVDPAQIERAIQQAAQQIVKMADTRLAAKQQEFDRLKKEVNATLSKLQKLVSTEEVQVSVDVTHNAPFTMKSPVSPMPEFATSTDAQDDTITEGAPEWMQRAHQRILNAAAWLSVFGISQPDRSVVAAIAGASPRSSAFSNNVSRLSAEKLIRYPRAGSGLIELTETGAALARAPQRAPDMARYHEAWRACPAFDPAHVKILNAIIGAYPAALSREDLAAAAKASPSSSAFNNNVSRLSAMGLIEYPEKGYVKATTLLFPQALA